MVKMIVSAQNNACLLSNNEWPERPLNKVKVDDDSIHSLDEKKPFVTSGQEHFWGKSIIVKVCNQVIFMNGKTEGSQQGANHIKRWRLYQNDAKRKVWRRRELAPDQKNSDHELSNMVEAWVAACGTVTSVYGWYEC